MELVEFTRKEKEAKSLLEILREKFAESGQADYPAEMFCVIAMCESEPMAILTSSASDFLFLTEVAKPAILDMALELGEA